MYLFFDTETTGLPKDWKAPLSQLDNWPRLVQLAFIQFDKEGQQLQEADYIVKPDRFRIPKASSNVHGITTEQAMAEGIEIGEVLEHFTRALKSSTHLIAHNMNFDEKIVGAEYLRLGSENHVKGLTKICTMRGTKDFCKLPGTYGFKAPKLTELHQKLFGKSFEDAHDALVDVKATARCFWELRSRGYL